jgi:hypothetical protein
MPPARAHWIHEMRPGPGFELFPWTQLSLAERNRLVEQKENYPAALTPFLKEERLEPCNSLGLRYENDVVGWMITHRTRLDTIQYSSLFVDPAVMRLQPGIGMAVLAKSVSLQIAAGVPRLIFMVNMDNPMGLNLIKRRIKPYLQSMVETRFSFKNLNGAGTGLLKDSEQRSED